MASRDRDISRIKPKRDRSRVETGNRRRVNKEDGKFADYSHLKASTGIVIPEVKRVLLDRKRIEAEHSAHRTGIIYPSEMAKSNWCVRATYYRMSGRPAPPSTSSFTLENVFAEGNSIHSKWQRWLSETGLLWGDWRCSRCSEIVRNSTKPEFSSTSTGCVGTSYVEYGDGIIPNTGVFPHDWRYKEVTLAAKTHRISGHADGALIKHNCLIEIKSVGIGSLKFEAPLLLAENTHTSTEGKSVLDIDGVWKGLHRPLLSHVRQGNVYLWMAQEMGLPFDSIVFLYEFKPNQQAKEFQIRMSEDILLPLLTEAARVEYALERGIPPVCTFGGCAQCGDYEKEDSDGKTTGKGILLS